MFKLVPLLPIYDNMDEGEFAKFFIAKRRETMAGEWILIIEDEVKIARFVELELQHEGYNVEQAHDGRTGLEMGTGGNYDLLIIDVMLPAINGMEVLRRFRQVSETPVIMLTAKDDVTDKVMGLDLGADDYMTKPFAIEELLARIRTILKRKRGAMPKKELTAGELSIDVDQYAARYKDKSIDLTKKEFDLLKFLVENQGIVLTRDKILEVVWGYDYYGDTNVVDVYIRYLRSKLDDQFNVKLIHTVRGVGYKLQHE